MLRVSRLDKRLGDFALHAVSFDVNDGDYFVLLGASGVGKTLLLETVAGLTQPDSGQLYWDDEDITRQRIQRRRMGLVYQDQALFPHMTARQNIAYGLRARKTNGVPVRDQVETLAEEVGATALLDRFPGTLSGGEAQRVALARALVTEPRCLLLDEPLSSLDMHARTEMRALLRALNRRGHTIVHVTHDYEEAVSLASRVAIMEHGTVVQVGDPQTVFQHPKSEFVARFIGIRNVLKGELGPAADSDGVAHFITAGLVFSVLTDAAPGPGYLILRSEDITVARSALESSAQNSFAGTIVDVARARLGVEVTIDVGVKLAALVTTGSLDRLDLRCGQEVWVSFKATAARFIED